MKLKAVLMSILISTGCVGNTFDDIVDQMDLEKFMGRWYVIAGRLTMLENQPYNSIEEYTWNEKKKIVNIKFTYNRGGFDGFKVAIPQTGWVHNEGKNTHWKIRPFLSPMTFDYLVLALADDYSWTAVGVPNGKYLWIMARDWKFSKEKVLEIKEDLKSRGYPVHDVNFVPQKWTDQ